MPFWYHLPILELDDPQPATVRLVQWLLDDGAEVHRGTKVAIIEAPLGRYVVRTNGDGFLQERLVPVGAEIESFAPIAVIAADGENIPYGKPYSLAQRSMEK